jgi:bacteriocin biosynthesis cyclodehydratase domain-containing protein
VGATWGDAAPPEEPLAARNVPLLAGLLANELTKVAAGDRGLANRTVALDLHQLRVVEGTLLKHPWCPACGRPDRSGDRGGQILFPRMRV